MVETFKNARLALTTTLADVYECPAGASAVVITCIAANVDGSSAADLDVCWTDAGASGALTYLAKAISVPAKASLDVINGNKIVLEAGDKVQSKASAAGDLELTLAVYERS